MSFRGSLFGTFVIHKNTAKITTKNIFKNAGLKDLEIKTSDKQDDTVQDITTYKAILEIISYEMIVKNEDFYSKLLEVLHYYVSKEQIITEIIKIDKEKILTNEQIEKIANMMAPIFAKVSETKKRTLYCCEDCKAKLMIKQGLLDA